MHRSVRQLAERLSRDVVFHRRLPECFGGASVFVSPAAGLRFWRPHIEKCDPRLLNLAADLVKPGAVVWDVGANVGLFSFAAAGLAGPSGRVLAIEPDQWLVSLLRRSVRANTKRTARVDILPVAISDSLDVKQFHIAQRSRSANYLDGYGLTDAGGSREMHLVPTATLDWLLERFPAPAVLKIDVEGSEVEVLKGAQRLLSEAQPVLLCEVGEQNSDAVAEYLRPHGYLLFDADLAKAERRPLARACWSTLALPKTSCPDYSPLSR